MAGPYPFRHLCILHDMESIPGNLLAFMTGAGTIKTQSQGHSLIHVTPQHTLKCLGLETALHNQSALPVQGAAGPQFCQQELLHMLRLAVHALVELHEVGEHRLLGAFPSHLHTTIFQER